jgi:prevent-host-death family protein
MVRLSIARIRVELAETLNRVFYRGERVVLQRHGKDVAVIVPLEDLMLLEALEDRMDVEAAKAALAEAREKGTIPWEQLEREFGGR